jgi:hypothetical protein
MNSDLKQVLEKIREADLIQFDGVPLDHANVRVKNFGETPLHIVAVWGDLEAVRILLDCGAEVDVGGEY